MGQDSGVDVTLVAAVVRVVDRLLVETTVVVGTLGSRAGHDAGGKTPLARRQFVLVVLKSQQKSPPAHVRLLHMLGFSGGQAARPPDVLQQDHPKGCW